MTLVVDCKQRRYSAVGDPLMSPDKKLRRESGKCSKDVMCL